MKRFCLAPDLKDDKKLIHEYEEHHKAVWPEIIDSVKDAGITRNEDIQARNRIVHDHGND